MDFADLIETTREISGTAERLGRESSNGWTPRSTKALGDLSERLVANLLPSLAAMESVISPHLDPDLSEATKADHRKMRQLIERIAIVSESMARDRRAKSDLRPVRLVLRDLTEALQQLRIHEDTSVRRLEATLSTEGLEEAARLFAEAAQRARTQILLVAQRQIPATEAWVLRRRYDLVQAFTIPLSDLERDQ